METKWCSHCKSDLPVSSFYSDKKTKAGLTAYCKGYYAAYYRENRERQNRSTRRAQVRRRYGLELEEYERLIALGCSVCTRQGARVVLDHCHATDTVRAPLCDPCNVVLGAVDDSPGLLRKLADYLEKHGSQSTNGN